MLQYARESFAAFQSRNGNKSCVVVIAPWHSSFTAGSQTTNLCIYHPDINRYYLMDADNTRITGTNVMRMIGHPRAHNLKLSMRVIGHDADDWPSDMATWCNNEKTIQRIRTFPTLKTWSAGGKRRSDTDDADDDDDSDDADDADDVEREHGAEEDDDDGGQPASKRNKKMKMTKSKEDEEDEDDAMQTESRQKAQKKSKSKHGGSAESDDTRGTKSMAHAKYFAYLEKKSREKACAAEVAKKITEVCDTFETKEHEVEDGKEVKGHKKVKEVKSIRIRSDDTVRQLLDEMRYVENVHSLLKQKQMQRILLMIAASM